jgi:hypothetical protein
MTIITAPAASPTPKVKLAMYRPQDTWSLIAVSAMPSTIWWAHALAPTSAIAVSTVIHV